PDHGHADVGADQEGGPCKRYRRSRPPAAPLGSQCPGASAAEETETPLGGRAGSVREAPGTSGSHGSEKSIVPRREQTLPGLNPFMLYNALEDSHTQFVGTLHVYTWDSNI